MSMTRYIKEDASLRENALAFAKGTIVTLCVLGPFIVLLGRGGVSR